MDNKNKNVESCTMHSVEATDLGDAWFQCLRLLIEAGDKYTISHGSYEGQMRLEADYVTVHIRHPEARPLVPMIPPSFGIPNPVEENYVEGYLPYLMTHIKQPNEDYTYGMYLESQIAEVIKMYKAHGFFTNQACMSVGDSDSIRLKDPPCLRLIDTRIKNDKLIFFVYFRSWDLWGGFPANLAGLQLLKEHMAEEIGVLPGETFAASKGLHIYDHAWEIAKIRTMCR